MRIVPLAKLWKTRQDVPLTVRLVAVARMAGQIIAGIITAGHVKRNDFVAYVEVWRTTTPPHTPIINRNDILGILFRFLEFCVTHNIHYQILTDATFWFLLRPILVRKILSVPVLVHPGKRRCY
jgi:hypothetical protein